MDAPFKSHNSLNFPCPFSLNSYAIALTPRHAFLVIVICHFYIAVRHNAVSLLYRKGYMASYLISILVANCEGKSF